MFGISERAGKFADHYGLDNRAHSRLIALIVDISQNISSFVSVLSVQFARTEAARKQAETVNTTAEAPRKQTTDAPAFRKPTQTKAARRLREIANGLRAELGRQPSTSEAALIAQCSTLIVQHEHALAAAGRGEPVDQVQALKLSGLIVRALSALRGKSGGKARSAPGPNLAEYLARKAAEKAAGAPAGDGA
jgi:hypothetical protein